MFVSLATGTTVSTLFALDARDKADAARLEKKNAEDSAAQTAAALEQVETTARGTGNLLPPMKEALRARATLGEVSDVLREVFGEYRPRH